jgi:hypothetical protein
VHELAHVGLGHSEGLPLITPDGKGLSAGAEL